MIPYRWLLHPFRAAYQRGYAQAQADASWCPIHRTIHWTDVYCYQILPKDIPAGIRTLFDPPP